MRQGVMGSVSLYNKMEGLLPINDTNVTNSGKLSLQEFIIKILVFKLPASR